ncbi:MAG: hypothetical protein GX351_03150 [Peptococcaceae bacterium]|nr:hypothetical protein [Peptococcaceae bacterium]
MTCYGGCTNVNCERCRPKWMICPSCGNRAFMQLKKCITCGAELPEEAKEKARALWRERQEKSK